MIALHRHADVVRMASELGVGDEDHAVNAIIAYCERKVARWLTKRPPVTSLQRLEQTVSEELQLVFEEVWSDDDLERIVQQYVALREFVFVQLRQDFDDHTFATLIERRNISADARDRYVAVIDCRGEKSARRYFTRWHEIAHLLTLIRQLELPFHRSRFDRCPIERLMDVVAGEIGFYGPIFQPALNEELRATGKLSFDGIERVRSSVCPDASFHATLVACVKRSPHPTIYIEAGLGLKKVERQAVSSRQMELIPSAPPVPKLRALVAAPNPAAQRARLRINANMQVPVRSIIAVHFLETGGQSTSSPTSGRENLSTWMHSDGRAVGDQDVEIEVRRAGKQVLALMRIA